MILPQIISRLFGLAKMAYYNFKKEEILLSKTFVENMHSSNISENGDGVENERGIEDI